MATVKGQNLRIFVNNVAIAAAQECSLSLQLSTNSSSTKDDTDDWQKVSTVALSWSVQAKGLVTIDPDRNDVASMMARIGQTVRVEMGIAGGVQNSEMGEQMLAGDAIVSDIQVDAQNQEESTYTITLTGKKDMLTDIRLLASGDGHYLRSASGNLQAAAHEN